jgi:hypothetical protein
MLDTISYGPNRVPGANADIRCAKDINFSAAAIVSTAVPALLVPVIVALLVLPAAAQPTAVDLVSLIDAYAHGRQDEAVAKAAAITDLGPLRLRFVQDTPGWVAADPAQSERRRRAVAGFIVELAAARLDTDWGRLSDLIEWTCAQILRSGPPSDFERAWHMSTTALAGRARTRLWLLGPFARLPHQKPRAPQKDDPPSPKHLLHAIERFPDDPHFQLARVIAWTWGRDEEPIRNLRRDDEDDLRARARRAPQLEALAALEPLIAQAEVAAEAFINIGRIHLTVRDHAAALRAFEQAQPLAPTPELQYLSAFLAGRAMEALGRSDEAAAQYRRALEIVPGAESATIALAALQFSGDARDEAVAMLDRLFTKPSTTADPFRLVGYGSFMHWPRIKAAMRKLL